MTWDERKPRKKPLSSWRVRLETYIEVNWKFWLFVAFIIFMLFGGFFLDSPPDDGPYPPRWN